MRLTQQPFSRFALTKSAEHAKEFSQSKLNQTDTQLFTQMAEQSLAKQQEIESTQQCPFDEFLAHYFSQK
jgi:glutamate--cysteine ligase